MEDPSIVLDMLAAGICQVTRWESICVLVPKSFEFSLGNAPLAGCMALKNASHRCVGEGITDICYCSSQRSTTPALQQFPLAPLVRCLLLLQLSTRYAEEGIEFSCLCQSDQVALQADVRSQLYHAAGHDAGAAPEWDELSITMQAYGGVTSVGLVRNGETPNDATHVVVSPTG